MSIRAMFVALLFAGCVSAQTAPEQITYAKDISRIFREKCESCHRDGDIGPFALRDFDTAVAWAADIRRVVSSRKMPPWKPVDGHGEFVGSLALTAEERQKIMTWTETGLALGDPEQMPPPLDTKSEWPLGAPDVELRMLQQYRPPRGFDVYRCFSIPTNFTETKYLSAIDVIPGIRSIVHHVLIFQDTTGASETASGVDGEPGYPCFGGPGIDLDLTSALGGWAPGQRTRHLPDGVGLEVQKGARIVIQVHYFPSRGTGDDQTRLGLYFSRGEVKQRLFHVPIVNQSFRIPPGAERFEVNASQTVLPLLTGEAVLIYPHMHLLGREIKVDILGLDRRVRPMIYENSWDFNWQGAYTYAKPMRLDAGDRVRLQCIFDNSEYNPRNPNNPLVEVRWGEKTTDEMCLVFLGVTLDLEKIVPFRLLQ